MVSVSRIWPMQVTRLKENISQAITFQLPYYIYPVTITYGLLPSVATLAPLASNRWPTVLVPTAIGHDWIASRPMVRLEKISGAEQMHYIVQCTQYTFTYIYATCIYIERFVCCFTS